jgi:glycosyltransferase involved in cell wall biosynthesis
MGCQCCYRQNIQKKDAIILIPFDNSVFLMKRQLLHTIRLSIVIPTIGSGDLERCLEHIFSGSLQPFEVFICIPVDVSFSTPKLFSEQVTVVRCPERGQVSQRAEGLRRATGDLVLQMDDDIYIPRTALELAASHLLELGEGSVVGPRFKDTNTGKISESDHRLIAGIRGAYLTYFGRLPRGQARFGAFSSLTCSLGISTRYSSGYRSELVLKNFYPFTGKAYCEDLLHSRERLKKGIKHFVVSEVVVSTYINTSKHLDLGFRNYISIVSASFKLLRRRWKVSRLLEATLLSMALYFLFEGINLLFRPNGNRNKVD